MFLQLYASLLVLFVLQYIVMIPWFRLLFLEALSQEFLDY